MIAAALAFALGCLACQYLPELPGRSVALGLLAMAALLGVDTLRRRWLILPALLFAGFGWSVLLAEDRMAMRLAAVLEGQDLEVIGRIAGLPQDVETGIRFDFAIERSAVKLPAVVSLTWYRGRRPGRDDWTSLPDLRAGDRWQLRVRLKRAHGSLNPHGQDAELRWLERGIGATGYVRPSLVNRRADGAGQCCDISIERWRQDLRDRYRRLLSDAPYAGVLIALAIGDQLAIDNELWRLFARTGVTHLLSVSGLHVTMLAGLAAMSIGWLWRRSSRAMLYIPAQKVAAAAGLLVALAYCLLAGFAVPAQRTLYMLAVVTLALWSGRTTAVSQVLASAVLLVLILDPWAVISPSFWLSFGAVAVLFYVGTGRLASGHWLASWGRAQWAVTVGMLPVLLALFQQFSLVSPFANAIAIPVVSLLVTPMTLLGVLPLATPLLALAHGILSLLMSWLTLLAGSSLAVWQQAAPTFWALLGGLLGAAWLLAPVGMPARWLGGIMLLPLFLTEASRPLPGVVWLTILDVGQGLAVHVQTASHDLLYDAGPAWSSDADSGSRIVVPYLRAVGVERLHALVVSHRDKDHEGGAAAVVAAIQVDSLLSSLPESHPLRELTVAQLPCQQGKRWRWDGVEFEFLHPTAAGLVRARSSNAVSCVLRVVGSERTVLLTGDIGVAEEQELLDRKETVAADVIVPSHHGSGSASSVAFVGAVGARVALFSAGYRNRFGHPLPMVIERFQSGGAAVYRTDREGALRVSAGRELTVTAERATRQRYWLRD